MYKLMKGNMHTSAPKKQRYHPHATYCQDACILDHGRMALVAGRQAHTANQAPPYTFRMVMLRSSAESGDKVEESVKSYIHTVNCAALSGHCDV